MFSVSWNQKLQHSVFSIRYSILIMNIGIIGSGTMGSGIAQVAATSGCKVKLYDTNTTALDKAKEGIYNPKSIKNMPSKYKKYFVENNDRFMINESIKKYV